MRDIINGLIILKDNVLEKKVLLFDKEIKDIVDENEFKNITKSGEYNDIEIIDAQGNYISPGFIDLHIHGSGGKDVMDGNIEDLKTISSIIATKGVTAFLP